LFWDLGILNPCPSKAKLIPGVNNYFPHLFSHRYIHCDFDGRAFVRNCAPGTKWRQEALTCLPDDFVLGPTVSELKQESASYGSSGSSSIVASSQSQSYPSNPSPTEPPQTYQQPTPSYVQPIQQQQQPRQPFIASLPQQQSYGSALTYQEPAPVSQQVQTIQEVQKPMLQQTYSNDRPEILPVRQPIRQTINIQQSLGGPISAPRNILPSNMEQDKQLIPPINQLSAPTQQIQQLQSQQMESIQMQSPFQQTQPPQQQPVQAQFQQIQQPQQPTQSQFQQTQTSQQTPGQSQFQQVQQLQQQPQQQSAQSQFQLMQQQQAQLQPQRMSAQSQFQQMQQPQQQQLQQQPQQQLAQSQFQQTQQPQQQLIQSQIQPQQLQQSQIQAQQQQNQFSQMSNDQIMQLLSSGLKLPDKLVNQLTSQIQPRLGEQQNIQFRPQEQSRLLSNRKLMNPLSIRN
jgi:hypothetical protein